MIQLILLMFSYVIISKSEVKVLFQTEVPSADSHLAMSEDGNCIATANYRNNKITLFRNSGNGFTNESISDPNINFTYKGGIFQNYMNVFSLDFDCQKLYIKTVSAVQQKNIKTGIVRQIGIHNNSNEFIFEVIKKGVLLYNKANNNINYIDENGTSHIISVPSQVTNSSLLKIYRQQKFENLSLMLRLDSTYYFYVLNLTNMEFIKKYQNNFVVSSQVLYIKQGICLFLQSTYQDYNHQYFYRLLLYKIQTNTTQIFNFEFNGGGYMRLSGNSKIVAFFELINSYKNQIILLDLQKLMNFGENNISLSTQLIIQDDYSIISFWINYEGDKIAYLRKNSAFNQELIMISHKLGEKQRYINGKQYFTNRWDDNNNNNNTNAWVFSIVSIALTSLVTFVILLFFGLIIRKIIKKKCWRQYNVGNESSNSFGGQGNNIESGASKQQQ